MNKHRLNTFQTLARMGISDADARTLVRISATLHTWHEHECNGAIQREELVRCSECKAPFHNPLRHSGCCDAVTADGIGCRGIAERHPGRPYWHNADSGKRIGHTADRETPAIRRAYDIAARYGLTAYVQGDPRGCALYLVRPGDVPAGADIDSYYSRGIAVVP